MRTETATQTGNYVITAYQCSDPITFKGMKELSFDSNDALLKEDPNSNWGSYLRGEKQICLSQPEDRGGHGHFEGTWYYKLNDGDSHLHVGPFADRDTAIASARESILNYRDVMGGRVYDISVAD